MPNTRIALSLAALLGASCLTPAQAGWFDSKSDKSVTSEKKPVSTPNPTPAAQDLDGAIRQAQLLRTDRHYDEAVHTLSQIMLVAADDPRVVAEYGKTLAAMGRASEAINFLTRAQQLSPNDWSVYSALGVAYDQTGDQKSAQAAYEHALSLKPGDASVLNNYALSRMLAKDPDGAQQLMARAQSAGGDTDPKIARNIAMMKTLAPATAVAANTPAPQLAPAPAPRVAVSRSAMPQVASVQPMPARAMPTQIMPTAAPRPLVAANPGVIDAPPMPMQNQPAGVVMQRVPVDPLAGPVQPKIALHMPAPSKSKPVKQSEAKPADTPNALEAKAEAIARQIANKPAAQAQAMAAAAKPIAPTAKTPDAKPAEKPVTKVADAKPAPAPAKPAPAPVKTAEAKPVPVKAAAKDQVPALRVSASAY